MNSEQRRNEPAGTTPASVNPARGTQGTRNHTSDRSDVELLAAYRAGDDTAAAALFERHHQHTVNYLNTKLPDSSIAEEHASEAFAKTLEILKRGHGPTENVGAYLRTIGMRITIDWYKLRDRSSTLDYESGEEHLERAELPTTVAADFQLEQTQNEIAAAFSALPEDSRKLLYYRYVDDKKAAEIAELFRLDVKVLSARLARAKQSLRAEYLHQLAITAAGAGCLSFADTLAKTVSGTLRTKQQRELGLHLDSCPSCALTLADLTEVNQRFSLGSSKNVLSAALLGSTLYPLAELLGEHPQASAAQPSASQPSAQLRAPQQLAGRAVQQGARSVASGAKHAPAWFGKSLGVSLFGGTVTLGSAALVAVGAVFIAALVFFGQDILGGKYSTQHAVGDSAQTDAPHCSLRTETVADELRIIASSNHQQCWLSYGRVGGEAQSEIRVNGTKIVATTLPGTYQVTLRDGERREERTVVLPEPSIPNR